MDLLKSHRSQISPSDYFYLTVRNISESSEHFYSCWDANGNFMCVPSTSALREEKKKKANVKGRYVEVTINMSLNVYHLEQ